MISKGMLIVESDHQITERDEREDLTQVYARYNSVLCAGIDTLRRFTKLGVSLCISVYTTSDDIEVRVSVLTAEARTKTSLQ